MAPERSGSTDSNGDKKKPSRKISRFLVSPVVDRGENLPEETCIQESDKEKAKENGLPEPSLPQDNYVPTHQYSSPTQAPVVDHRPEIKPVEPEVKEVPSMPQSMINATALQSNLTTPLQIATDTPLLGE